MKKQLLFLVSILLPIYVSAYDIYKSNEDGQLIYYNRYQVQELEVTYCDASHPYKGTVNIPQSVDVYENTTTGRWEWRTRYVTIIGSSAFYKDTYLYVVNMPSTILEIKDKAFYGCEGLETIVIPNSVKTMGVDVFCSCSGLKSITIGSGLTSISGGSFSGCTNLSSITIPSTVTSIGHSAFSGCTKLEDIELPNSITSIGQYAFENCSSLTELILPENIEIISPTMMQGCSSLKSIVIPQKVTLIGYNAFRYCTSLETLTIGRNVSVFGSTAFDGCTALKEIKSYIEQPFSFSSSVFSREAYENAKLIVPYGTLEKYKATDGWKNFKNIVEGTSDIGQVMNDDRFPIYYYTIDCKQIREPQKGLNIVHMKDGTTKKVVVK